MSTLHTARQNSAMKIKKLVMAAMFCAIAFAVTFVMRINVMFLTFDAKDAVITIAGLLFGPVYALAISLVTAVLEMVTVGDTGFWGFLMDFLSTAVFSVTCSLIYKHKKNIKGAVIGLACAIVSTTVFMILFNIFITPIYMGVERAQVIALLPSLFAPFNFVKATLNAGLVLVLYKPASTAMKAARVLPTAAKTDSPDLSPTEKRKKNAKFSFAVTLAGLLVIVLCVVVFFVFMNGKFEAVQKIETKAEETEAESISEPEDFTDPESNSESKSAVGIE